MQIDLNALQDCKFKGKDVNEIFYNNVKIWPIETILNFIDPLPEGDYLSFAPVINSNDTTIQYKHWHIDFKIFTYQGNYYNNLFNNTNGIVFGEKRIDKFINGQFIEGTWQPIRFEEDVNIYYNEILRVRYDKLNVDWNDVKTQYNVSDLITKVNITTVCQLKLINNSYSVVNDECYLYGKLKTFKDNTGKYIDDVINNEINNAFDDEINRFFVEPEYYADDEDTLGIYQGVDYTLSHKHNVIYHSTHKLELLDPTIILDGKLADNINAKCYNLISYRNFCWNQLPTIINNLELEFNEKIKQAWFDKYPVNILAKDGVFYNSSQRERLTRVNNFKITVNEFDSNLEWTLTWMFWRNYALEYVKIDYDGVLNIDNAVRMFGEAGTNVEHPVLVKRGGAATVDRQGIGLGGKWIIKDFDEE